MAFAKIASKVISYLLTTRMPIFHMNSFRKAYVRRAHRLVTAFSVIPLLIYALLGLKISFLAPGFELNTAHSDSCGCIDSLLIQHKWIAVMGA